MNFVIFNFQLKMVTGMNEHQEWAGSVVYKYAEQFLKKEWYSQIFNLGHILKTIYMS